MKNYLKDKFINKVTRYDFYLGLIHIEQIIKETPNIEEIILDIKKDFKDYISDGSTIIDVIHYINRINCSESYMRFPIYMNDNQKEHLCYLIKKYKIKKVALTTMNYFYHSDNNQKATLRSVTFDYFKEVTNPVLYEKLEPYLNKDIVQLSNDMKIPQELLERYEKILK